MELHLKRALAFSSPGAPGGGRKSALRRVDGSRSCVIIFAPIWCLASEIHFKTDIQPQEKQNARLPKADEDARRPGSFRAPPPEKTMARVGRLAPGSPSTPALWLVIRKSRHGSKRRPVISVPRRIVKLSVRRSRLKRLIREAVRLDGRVSGGGMPLFFSVRGPVPDKVKLSHVQSLLDRFLGET